MAVIILVLILFAGMFYFSIPSSDMAQPITERGVTNMATPAPSPKNKIFRHSVDEGELYENNTYDFSFRYPEALMNEDLLVSSEAASLRLCPSEIDRSCYDASNIFSVDIHDNPDNLTAQQWAKNYGSEFENCAINKDPRGKLVFKDFNGYKGLYQEYILDYQTIMDTCAYAFQELNFSQGKYKHAYISAKGKIFHVGYINETYSKEDVLNKIFNSFKFNN